MRSQFARIAALVLLMLPMLAAQAEIRAWLDRERVSLGETATLNIETDQAGADAPDYSALMRDFDLSGNTSSRRMPSPRRRWSRRARFGSP